MSFDAHKNLAYSTVAVAPSPASSGTSLTVSTGQGALFPTTPFNATVWPVGVQPLTTNAEIVRVTNITGDVLTITRTQENTSARTIIIGDQIANTITVKVLTDIEIAPIFGTSASTPILTSPTNLIIKPGADSTTAIQIQNAAGSANIITIDTTNKVTTHSGPNSTTLFKVTDSSSGVTLFDIAGNALNSGSYVRTGIYSAFTTTNYTVESLRVNGASSRYDGNANMFISWFATTGSISGAPDTSLSRLSAGTLGVGTGSQGSTAGSLQAATINYIATENGANNAIACAAASGPTLTTGLCISILLAHSLQAGANTFAYNGGGALNIRSHRNPANNIAAAYVSGGIISLQYDGVQWQDMSQ